MCFSTTPSSFLQSASTSTSSAFTGQTHGGGPSGNGFSFPLCAIRRVERLHSQNFQVIAASRPFSIWLSPPVLTSSGNHLVALAITTWNGITQESGKDKDASRERKDTREQRITIHLAGSRQACERFCDGLKKGLRAGVGNVGKLKKVVSECYSEYLLRPDEKKNAARPTPAWACSSDTGRSQEASGPRQDAAMG